MKALVSRIIFYIIFARKNELYTSKCRPNIAYFHNLCDDSIILSGAELPNLLKMPEEGY